MPISRDTEKPVIKVKGPLRVPVALQEGGNQEKRPSSFRHSRKSNVRSRSWLRVVTLLRCQNPLYNICLIFVEIVSNAAIKTAMQSHCDVCRALTACGLTRSSFMNSNQEPHEGGTWIILSAIATTSAVNVDSTLSGLLILLIVIYLMRKH